VNAQNASWQIGQAGLGQPDTGPSLLARLKDRHAVVAREIAEAEKLKPELDLLSRMIAAAESIPSVIR